MYCGGRQACLCCREEALPEAIKAGGSVRKGTVLVFTRDQAGNLTARADDHDLISVRRCAAHRCLVWLLF